MGRDWSHVQRYFPAKQLSSLIIRQPRNPAFFIVHILSLA